MSSNAHCEDVDSDNQSKQVQASKVPVTMLFKFSSKRNAVFDQIDSEDEHSFGGSIRSICPTKWTVHGDSITDS